MIQTFTGLIPPLQNSQ